MSEYTEWKNPEKELPPINQDVWFQVIGMVRVLYVGYRTKGNSCQWLAHNGDIFGTSQIKYWREITDADRGLIL